MSKKVSLNELMGKAGSKAGNMSLDDLKDILGERMPEMPRNQVGRFRLIRSLKQRFGDGFRNIPGVKGLIKEFDEDIEFQQKLDKMKSIKVESNNG